MQSQDWSLLQLWWHPLNSGLSCRQACRGSEGGKTFSHSQVAPQHSFALLPRGQREPGRFLSLLCLCPVSIPNPRLLTCLGAVLWHLISSDACISSQPLQRKHPRLSCWTASTDQWLQSLSHRQDGAFKWNLKSPVPKNHRAWRGALQFLVLFQRFLFQWI